MNVTIIGTGFVGVVTSAVVSSLNNTVVGLDIDDKKVASLKAGKVPFYEPGLEELLLAEQTTGRLTFTTDYKAAISDADVVMIAVGTPSASDGTADLKFVKAATASLAPHLKENAVVVVKSTVPPGTLDIVSTIISQHTKVTFHMASVPEFLREGSAVEDTLHPDRIVIGVTTDFAFEKLSELHKPLNAPIIRVRPESAQMGKYTANAYLATRITFINQIANLCETNGADIAEVISVIGEDERIGKHYWYPGLGYGGSCFPKDVKELAAYAKSLGQNNNLMVTIDTLNEQRIPHMLSEFVTKIDQGWKDKIVAVLGLSFKPNTNDTREAPSLKVIPELLAAGAQVVAYDPKAIQEAQHIISEHPELKYADNLSQAVQNADVVLVLIEWEEFTTHDFTSTKLTKPQWFIDARNQFDKEKLTKAGYTYIGVGR